MSEDAVCPVSLTLLDGFYPDPAHILPSLARKNIVNPSRVARLRSAMSQQLDTRETRHEKSRINVTPAN